VDREMTSSSISTGIPLKNNKGIHRSEVESSDMDIDDVHVSKRPRIS